MQAEIIIMNFNEGRIRRQLRSYGIVTGHHLKRGAVSFAVAYIRSIAIANPSRWFYNVSDLTDGEFFGLFDAIKAAGYHVRRA